MVQPINFPQIQIRLAALERKSTVVQKNLHALQRIFTYVAIHFDNLTMHFDNVTIHFDNLTFNIYMRCKAF